MSSRIPENSRLLTNVQHEQTLQQTRTLPSTPELATTSQQSLHPLHEKQEGLMHKIGNGLGSIASAILGWLKDNKTALLITLAVLGSIGALIGLGFGLLGAAGMLAVAQWTLGIICGMAIVGLTIGGAFLCLFAKGGH